MCKSAAHVDRNERGSHKWGVAQRGDEVGGRDHWSPHHVEDPHTEDSVRDAAQSILQASPHFCGEGVRWQKGAEGQMQQNKQTEG